MNAAIGAPIRLETLEARAAVMQRVRCRMQRQGAQRGQLKGGPGAILIVGDGHEIGEHAAEGRGTWIRLVHDGIIGEERRDWPVAPPRPATSVAESRLSGRKPPAWRVHKVSYSPPAASS